MRELERQREVADAARRLAEAANHEKSRFLAAASHDLRQPVHALGLFTEAARKAESEGERRRAVEHIEASVLTLTALFDSLLEVSRLDSGLLRPELVTVSLAPLLRALAAEHAAEANAKGLALRVRVVDAAVRTDPVLLQRLLRNLLANGLGYTRTGGVVLAAQRRSGSVRVGVWDTGIGIAEAEQARIFDEFYQVGNTERDRRNGVGLGLAIVKRVATLLGLEVRVASRVRRGSRFTLELPLSLDAPSEPTDEPRAADDEALLGAVVVVIDDEPSVIAALELVLKQRGCRVISAASGAEARSLLSEAELRPDLIVCDYRLRAGETGRGAIALLHAEYPDLPAVIVSGDPSADADTLGTDGVVGVLQKPVRADVLVRTLSRALDFEARPGSAED